MRWARWWLAYRRAVRRATTAERHGNTLAVAVARRSVRAMWYRRP